MLSTIRAIVLFLSQLFGLIQEQSALRNTPEMKTAAKAQDEIDQASKSEKAIANENMEEIRNELAE